MNRLALPAVVLALLGLVGWLMLSPNNNSVVPVNDEAQIDADNMRSLGYSEQRLAEIAADQRRRDLERRNIADAPNDLERMQLEYGSASFTGYVVDPQGEPLADIKIKMAVSRKWQYIFDPTDENLINLWTASTATNGFFYFPAAEYPQADYLLQIATEGFPVMQIENLTANIGFSRDLGKIRLAAPAIISGKVVDENNQGVENVLIESFIALERGRHQQIETAFDMVSASDGTFVTTALPARDVYLQAELDGMVSEVSPKIKLKEGEEFSDLTIVLRKPQYVGGKVVDEHNQPLAGAVVSQDQDYLHDSIDNAVTTAADGGFSLPLDPRDSIVTVFAKAEGYRLGQKRINDLSVNTTIMLRPLPTVSGMVRDHNQRPVAGATVVLCNRSISTQLIGRGIDLEQCSGSAVTDSEGNFMLTATTVDAENKWMKLVAFTEQHPPTQYSKAISFFDRGKTLKDYNDIVIDLNKGFRVAGSVTSSSGATIDKAQVLLRRLEKPRRSRLPSVDVRRGGNIIDQLIVNASGAFEFINLEDGEYRVEVYHRDFSPTQSEDFSLVDVDYTCKLIMQAPGGISGQFIGDITKFPNLIVQATSPGLDLIQVKPATDGSFKFLNLMPGTYGLQAHDVLSANRGKWWQSAQSPLAELDGIEVTAGTYTHANLEINSAGFASISGYVKINGAAAVSYKVFAVPHMYGAVAEDQRMVVRENVMHMREARTNPDGSFEISGIVTNDYWVIVERPTFRTWDMAALAPTGLAVHEISINNARQYQVDFNIHTGSVKVIAQQNKNRRGRGITLVPVPEDGRNHQSLHVPADKPRTHDGIPEGTYEWYMRKSDTPQRVFVPAGGVVEISVKLPKDSNYESRSGGIPIPPR
ncbi:MAG TPA: carboxypeptidase regulatory-like domain-containing protein [Planctomycetes bacterium]|nr:carboxypeptidase regulatory-like domain-containing protein [Planctomycetota bacterium]